MFNSVKYRNNLIVCILCNYLHKLNLFEISSAAYFLLVIYFCKQKTRTTSELTHFTRLKLHFQVYYTH